jgi:hypothetical protein
MLGRYLVHAAQSTASNGTSYTYYVRVRGAPEHDYLACTYHDGLLAERIVDLLNTYGMQGGPSAAQQQKLL